ncbi:MAG TPA: hypothetical protein VGY56_04715 [Verrucomicrobiae bacterium]|nr:hypothetical protein [Verrucomicrobiae bacterium]
MKQLASTLYNTWGKTSLEELRIQADRNNSGVAFESVRADDGNRLMIALCATDIDQIALLEKNFDFVEDGVKKDWNALSLVQLALQLMQNGGGLRFMRRVFRVLGVFQG